MAVVRHYLYQLEMTLKKTTVMYSHLEFESIDLLLQCLTRFVHLDEHDLNM